MADLIEVPIKGGTLVFAAAGSEGPQAFSGGSLTERATESIEQVLDGVRNLGETIAGKLSNLGYADAEVCFGIKVTGTGKFIVAEASTEASISIKLLLK
jgi:hypothetical protein